MQVAINEEHAIVLRKGDDVCTSDRSGNSLRPIEQVATYASPVVAATTAVFGLGVVAIPLLNAVVGQGTHEETLRRLGPLDPNTVADELLLDEAAVAERCNARASKTLEQELEQIQGWCSAASGTLAVLERRSALAFLGLDSDASPEDIARMYKRKALEVHPDKGGNDEDFQLLQDMRGRLEDVVPEGADEDRGPKSRRNLFQQMHESCKAKAAERQDAQPAQDNLPESVKLQLRRAEAHRRVVSVWERAEESKKALPETTQRHSLEFLREFVDGFVEKEIKTVPVGDVCAAERVFFKFLRQGLESIAAAALLDANLTMRTLTTNFIAKLVSRADSAKLQGHFVDLQAAVTAIPSSLNVFLEALNKRWEALAAEALKGCIPEQVSAKLEAKVADAADNTGGSHPVEGAANSADDSPTPSEKASPEAWAELLRQPVRAAPGSAMTRRVSPTRELAKPAARPATSSGGYQDSPEWWKLRASCVKNRVCVDYNRDGAGIRCTDIRNCRFRHVCVVCGKEPGLGPQEQYKFHGGWNCPNLPTWLACHK